MIKVVFMGIQGSGKGTQAKLLSDRLGVKHINVGQIFRDHIHSKTDLGQIFQGYIDRGEFVPDKYVFRMIEDHPALKEPQARGVILDGFPRNLAQARYLLQYFFIDRVFLFELESDEVAIKRIVARRVCPKCGEDYNLITKKPLKEGICNKCGTPIIQRSDDTVDALQTRFEKFHTETEPLADFFNQHGILSRIQAQRPPNLIHKEILHILSIDQDE